MSKKSVRAEDLIVGDMVYSGRQCLFVDELVPIDDRHVSVRYTNGDLETLARVAKVAIHVDDEDETGQTSYAEDDE